MENDFPADLVELLSCPFCGSSSGFIERADFSSCYVICNDCGARGASSCDETDEDANASEGDRCEPGELPARRLWNRRAAALPEAGWIVGNGDGTVWRTWDLSGSAWTLDREKATRYARRLDAELVHAEDEDAWRVEPYAPGTEPHPDPRDAEIGRLREVLEDLMSWFPEQAPEPEWRLKAGKYGADDAIVAARAALYKIDAPDGEKGNG